MDPLTLALIGGGIGLAKSELIDRPRAQRQRKTEAEIARWSPWTGMAPQRVQEADPFGSALQGAMGLGMLGASINQAQTQNQLLEAQKNYFAGQGQPPMQMTPAVGGGPGGGMGLGVGYSPMTAGMSPTLPPAMGGGLYAQNRVGATGSF